MAEIVDFQNIIGASNGDTTHVLGKFLYFSLSSVLVEKETLNQLCTDLGIPYFGGGRVSVSDAFRSATGDIRQRVVARHYGQQQIYQVVYCRDNERTPGILSRELVKETINQEANQYEKLANISYDKADGAFRSDNLAYDPDIGVLELCRKAEELFELYQRCANRKQIESICTGYLRGLEATKQSGNGHLYFVPKTFMEKVDTLEALITALNGQSQNDAALTVNSFYIIDDAKQRDKMAEEFYLAVKKEIVEYQDKADYFIKSGCQSPAVLERWVLKIGALEEKKRHYEDVLRRELTGLDDEFSTLQFLGQELSVRARGIRFQKTA